MGGPYFSMEGMCFQTPGSDIEAEINVKKAMDFVRAYVMGAGNPEDAGEALDYLEGRYGKIKTFTAEIRSTFALDDFVDQELRDRICRRAYNRICARLEGVG